jgi:putative flippase GtrA
LTLAHILPALAFVLVAPFAIVRRFSAMKWPERLIFPLGAIVGLTAYAMSAYAVGGWIERGAVLFFNSLFLFSLSRAWIYRTRGQSLLKRRWLMRAIGVLLGIATTRPVMGTLFATSSLTHLTPSQFFGIAFWIGFSINWVAVEAWLRNGRRTA